MPTKKTPAPATKAKKAKAPSALDKLRPRIEAIPEDHLRAASIPVDRLVAEAAALARVVRRHEAVLLRVGVDAKVLRELSLRNDALAEAQVSLTLSRARVRSAEEVRLEAEATTLRSDMIADCRFALRNDTDVQATLDTIQEGDGIDDLLQDLRELSQLFARNAKPLRAVGAQPAVKAKSADALVRRLTDLVSERRGRVSSDGAERRLRDRAVVFLEDALREIRAAGVYAFRKEPAKQLLYRSAYRSTRRPPHKNTANGKGDAASGATA